MPPGGVVALGGGVAEPGGSAEAVGGLVVVPGVITIRRPPVPDGGAVVPTGIAVGGRAATGDTPTTPLVPDGFVLLGIGVATGGAATAVPPPVGVVAAGVVLPAVLPPDDPPT